MTGGLALDARSTYESTQLQRTAADARQRYDSDRLAAGIAVGVGVSTGIVALAVYPSGLARAPARLWSCTARAA